MHVHFSDPATSPRWAWTGGLAALGQQEFAVPLAWPEPDERDVIVERMLHFIGHYVMQQPRRIIAGETFTYGWTMLRMRVGDAGTPGANRLVIQEWTTPLRGGAHEYADGIARAVRLRQAQDDVMRRNRLTGGGDYPHCTAYAIICKKLSPLAPWPVEIFAHRLPHDQAGDSGWFIGCVDDDHDHDDPDQLGRVHLLHLVEHCPRLFPYLAAPDETQVAFEAEKTIVFPPDAQTGEEDDAPFFMGLDELAFGG